MEKELSTEEKIKEAARKLFTHKGFAATRTRDIAQEAGINLALLNYYFRNHLFRPGRLRARYVHFTPGRTNPARSSQECAPHAIPGEPDGDDYFPFHCQPAVEKPFPPGR
jgi:hypothetical protein